MLSIPVIEPEKQSIRVMESTKDASDGPVEPHVAGSVGVFGHVPKSLFANVHRAAVRWCVEHDARRLSSFMAESFRQSMTQGRRRRVAAAAFKRNGELGPRVVVTANGRLQSLKPLADALSARFD
jgi:hypothetical protein